MRRAALPSGGFRRGEVGHREGRRRGLGTQAGQLERLVAPVEPLLHPTAACTQGAANTAARPSSSAISCCGNGPVIVTSPPSRSRRIWSATCPSSGPVPAIVSGSGRPRSRSSAIASTRSGTPFFSTSRPTSSTPGSRSAGSVHGSVSGSSPL